MRSFTSYCFLICSLLFSALVHATIPASERAVLLNFYNSTIGPNWKKNDGWNGPVGTECSWYGIFCYSNHIYSIMITDNNLVGTLPSLSGLIELKSINVSNNQLTGSIPSLSGLTNLSHFDVSNNNLTGSIPSLSGLTELSEFDAAQNQLTGAISSLSGLTNLRYIKVYDNRLIGAVPDVPSSNFSAFICNNSLVSSGNPVIDAAWMNSALLGNVDWLACQVPLSSTTMTPMLTTMVAGGNYHSLALRSDGTVVGWGYDGEGETTIPTGLTNLKAIAAGGYHSLALKSDRTVVGWGYNGLNETSIPAGLTNVTDIAAGVYHSLALKSDGTVVAWGNNYSNEATVPAGLSNVTAIAGGGYHSLALKSDGTVVGWGYNGEGETTIPAGLTNIKAIEAGDYHSIALKLDGTIAAWGNNYYGQTNIPAGLTNVTAIASGAYHSLALKSDGTVVGWGYNGEGETTIPAGLNNVVAIAAGGYHSLALKSDGTMAAWGFNGYGQTTIPPLYQFSGCNLATNDFVCNVTVTNQNQDDMRLIFTVGNTSGTSTVGQIIVVNSSGMKSVPIRLSDSKGAVYYPNTITVLGESLTVGKLTGGTAIASSSFTFRKGVPTPVTINFDSACCVNNSGKVTLTVDTTAFNAN